MATGAPFLPRRHLPSHCDLLGADAAGDAGQGVVVEEGLGRALQVAVGDEVDEAGDVDPHGAAVDAGRVLALQAALGLRGGQDVGEAQVDLVEVAGADRAACSGMDSRPSAMRSRGFRTGRVVIGSAPARRAARSGGSGARRSMASFSNGR